MVEQEESVYKSLMYANVALVPFVNYYLVRTAATDPGIVPARSWQGCKQEISKKYSKADKNSRIFYHALN